MPYALFATRTMRASTGSPSIAMLSCLRWFSNAAHARARRQTQRAGGDDARDDAPAARVRRARRCSGRAVVGEADVVPPLRAVERLQRRERIVAVEAEIPSEVVAGAERDADERDSMLERGVSNRGERAVAARGRRAPGARPRRRAPPCWPLLGQSADRRSAGRSRVARSRALCACDRLNHIPGV